ncbi:MAG TPA: PrsW family intramembrane metalloprotease [Rubrobacteraceae bacterium]|nr:PrsW family intramembrane metalloprotease [Rubrobacteraceae bacterium]
MQGTIAMTLSGTLIGAGVLQTILYLLFIRAIDLYEREPLRYVVPVFIWGFAVATTISLVFNTVAMMTFEAVATRQVADFLTAVIVAPVVEESTKGLALLIIFVVAYLASRRRRLIEFAGVMDGIVYGSAVGFGFALAEDILYGVQFGAETFLVRRILGGFAHAAFTSLTGIGVGLIPFIQNRALRIIPPLLGLLGAILLHATFNFLAITLGPVAYLFMFVMVLVYLLVIVVWLAFERRTIRVELRDEVDRGLISAGDYAILPTYFRRTGYYLRLIFSGRLGEWFGARKMHSAAVDLAFAKRFARRWPTPAREERVQALRQKILNLRPTAAPKPGF